MARVSEIADLYGGGITQFIGRLEALNKKYRTYILAGEETVTKAGGDFSFEELGQVTVKSRTSPTKIFTVHDTPDANPQSQSVSNQGYRTC